MLVKKNNIDCQEEMWNEKKKVSCVLLTFLPTLQHRHTTSSFDPVIITAAARGLCHSNKKNPTFFTYCVLGRLLRQPALSFFLAGHSANVLSRSGQQRVMIWSEKIIKGSMCKMLRVGRSGRPPQQSTILHIAPLINNFWIHFSWPSSTDVPIVYS